MMPLDKALAVGSQQ